MKILKSIDVSGISGKLVDLYVNRPKLVIDKNITGNFQVGEYERVYCILSIPLKISNIGREETIMNYLQLFILNEKKHKIMGYGFKQEMNISICPGGSFSFDLGKILFVRSDEKSDVFEQMFSSVDENNLTSYKLFAKILLKTPHKRWVFEIPLIRMYSEHPYFIESFEKIKNLDKKFRGADSREIQ